jgi:hypothetical protein
LENAEARAIPSMSLQWEPDERDIRYLDLCTVRLHGRDDEEVAKKYGLPLEALYQQIANDGFPVCPECGGLRPNEEHRREHAARKRRARQGGGDSVEIPMANAAPLFEKAGEKWREDIEEIRRLQLHLEGGRFVVRHKLKGARDKAILESGLEGESVRVYWRDKVDPGFWRSLCKEHGLDPDDSERTHVMIPTNLDRQEGASPTPPRSLRAVIAYDVLTGGDVEEWLAAIHPAPDEVDRAALYKDNPKRPGPIEGLKKYAEQVATAVCGGAIRPGKPGPEVSKYEHRATVYVRQRREQGVADKEILAELRDGAIWPLPLPITLGEVRRLGDLKLD